jgi:hypothetical protein
MLSCDATPEVKREKQIFNNRQRGIIPRDIWLYKSEVAWWSNGPGQNIGHRQQNGFSPVQGASYTSCSCLYVVLCGNSLIVALTKQSAQLFLGRSRGAVEQVCVRLPGLIREPT